MSSPDPPAAGPRLPDAGALALLEWQIAMGADEAIGEIAPDRLSAPPAATVPAPGASPPPSPPRQAGRVGGGAPSVVAPPGALAELLADAAQSARLLAGSAETIEALGALVASFEGCALKRTATNTVFLDGNPAAPVMIIGEAPGAEEDRLGRPFVGRAGQLLDRMLVAIGLDRTGVQITNVIYWRPPGNRKPTTAEIAACLPFVLRHIALARPRRAGAGRRHGGERPLPLSEGITRLRGRWFELAVPGLDRPVPTLPMFHPAFLLRTPERKREAWRDLLALKARLDAAAPARTAALAILEHRLRE